MRVATLRPVVHSTERATQRYFHPLKDQESGCLSVVGPAYAPRSHPNPWHRTLQLFLLRRLSLVRPRGWVPLPSSSLPVLQVYSGLRPNNFGTRVVGAPSQVQSPSRCHLHLRPYAYSRQPYFSARVEVRGRLLGRWVGVLRAQKQVPLEQRARRKRVLFVG